MIKFYGYFRSSAAYRCRIAFNLKNIEYDFIPIHLRKDGGQQNSPEFKKINPQSLLPSIEDNGFILSQSLAIIEWLDDKYPMPNLLPKDINLRAQARAFAQSIACEIHPLQNLRVQNYIKDEFNQDDKKVSNWLKRWLGGGLKECEEIIKKSKNFDFCFGDQPTIADLCLVPQIFSEQRFNIDLSDMPKLTSIYNNCSQLDAFKEAHPSKQPDYEKS